MIDRQTDGLTGPAAATASLLWASAQAQQLNCPVGALWLLCSAFLLALQVGGVAAACFPAWRSWQAQNRTAALSLGASAGSHPQRADIAVVAAGGGSCTAFPAFCSGSGSLTGFPGLVHRGYVLELSSCEVHLLGRFPSLPTSPNPPHTHTP